MDVVRRIGRYEIVSVLGQGLLGTVYLAFDRELERHVAIKLIRDDVDADELRARLGREVRAAVALVHPNIVLILDLGEHDGRLFIAMEYVEGETLAAVLRRDPTIPLGQRLTLIEQLCDGLSSVHDAGMVHRDLRPSNLMVSRAGLLKILDFGLDPLWANALTARGALIGAQFYMSPEQMNGGEADRRSDLFAVGLILYECITLRRAWAPDGLSLLRQISSERPFPIEQLCADVDPELVAIVERSVSKDPVDRYQDARSLGTDLRRIRERLSSMRSIT